jgi:hypothetical protein
MKELIHQAFVHVAGLRAEVDAGHYDLLGPDGQVIYPPVWETVVEPGMKITMLMWPPPPAQNTPGNARPLKEHRKRAPKLGGVMAVVAKIVSF